MEQHQFVSVETLALGEGALRHSFAVLFLSILISVSNFDSLL